MKKYCFGVDVGGTTIKLGLFDIEGTVLDKWEIVTRTEENGCHIIPDAAKSILAKIEEKKIDKEKISGVGVGVPGPVSKEGVVAVAVNLGWRNYPVSQTLSELVGLPVKTENDANVAALGEMWKGGGSGYTSIVAVTLGTGVGGGIIIDGKIFGGSNGSGGEIGHIFIKEGEEEVCGCGGHGCLEQYVSATGIVRMAKRKLAANTKPTTLTLEDLSAKMVFDAIKAEDEVAIELANEFGEYLGRGLGIVASIVNPEIFVIGGGVSKAGQVIIDYTREHFKKYAFDGVKGTLFGLAKLGNDAGIYGAAKMILE